MVFPSMISPSRIISMTVENGRAATSISSSAISDAAVSAHAGVADVAPGLSDLTVELAPRQPPGCLIISSSKL